MAATLYGKPLLYGAVGVVGIVALVGAFYLYGNPARVGDTVAAEETPAVAVPRPNARVATAQPPADPATLSQNQIDQATHFVGDARRFAATGDFSEAEGALQRADTAAPGLPETAQARRDIAEMRTPQGQLALHIQKARSALERSDYAAADRALGDAERLEPQASPVTQLRRDLLAARQEDLRKTDRLTSLLTAMRSALAQNDFATANRALNEAERIDIQNPIVREARVELNRAQRKN